MKKKENHIEVSFNIDEEEAIKEPTYYAYQDHSNHKYFEDRIHCIRIPVVGFSILSFYVRSNNTHTLIDEIHLFLKRMNIINSKNYYFIIDAELVYLQSTPPTMKMILQEMSKSIADNIDSAIMSELSNMQ